MYLILTDTVKIGRTWKIGAGGLLEASKMFTSSQSLCTYLGRVRMASGVWYVVYLMNYCLDGLNGNISCRRMK